MIITNIYFFYFCRCFDTFLKVEKVSPCGKYGGSVGEIIQTLSAELFSEKSGFRLRKFYFGTWFLTIGLTYTKQKIWNLKTFPKKNLWETHNTKCNISFCIKSSPLLMILPVWVTRGSHCTWTHYTYINVYVSILAKTLFQLEFNS